MSNAVAKVGAPNFLPASLDKGVAALPEDSAGFCKALNALHDAGQVLQVMTTAARFVLGMELSFAKKEFGETRGKAKTDNVSVFPPGIANYGQWVKKHLGFSERQARRFVSLVEALREGKGEGIGLPAKLFPEVRPSSLNQTQREALFRTIGQAVGNRSFFSIGSAVETIDVKAGHELTDEERNKQGHKPDQTTEEQLRLDAIELGAKAADSLDRYLKRNLHANLPTPERLTMIDRLEAAIKELKEVGA